MATKKFICIKQCYRRNPQGKWKLYEVNESEWFDADIDKPHVNHWVEAPIGQPASAYDVLKLMCTEIGIHVEDKWDITRLQREYDHKKMQMMMEQDKTVMASTVPQADGGVETTRRDVPIKKK